jgi:hypothetical protein
MNVENLLAESKIRFDFISQKNQLKEKYQSKMIFADQGGLWISSLNFISELNGIDDEIIILLDNYENPIKVNRKQLLDKAKENYNNMITQWYEEYSLLKNNR